MNCLNCQNNTCTLNCESKSLTGETNVQRENIYTELLREIDNRNLLRKSLAKLKYQQQTDEINPAAFRRSADVIRQQIDDQNLYIKNLSCAIQLQNMTTASQLSLLQLECSKKTFLRNSFRTLIKALTPVRQPKTPSKSLPNPSKLNSVKLNDNWVNNVVVNESAKRGTISKQTYSETLSNYMKAVGKKWKVSA